MKFAKYLAIRKVNNWKASARITDKKPTLHPDEIVVYLNINVPDALFQKPALRADIIIDEKLVPEQISAEVIDNIKEIVREKVGLTIELNQLQQ